MREINRVSSKDLEKKIENEEAFWWAVCQIWLVVTEIIVHRCWRWSRKCFANTHQLRLSARWRPVKVNSCWWILVCRGRKGQLRHGRFWGTGFVKGGITAVWKRWKVKKNVSTVSEVQNIKRHMTNCFLGWEKSKVTFNIAKYVEC